MRTFDGGGYEAGGAGEPQCAVALPDGVAGAVVGADLAGLLDGVSVERVSGHDTVTYMAAAHRLATHYQGLFLKALLETGMRLPAPDDQVVRAEEPGEFAAEEARAALVWSRSRADGTFGRAYEMFALHPQIGEALLDARIDEPRARAFCGWTGGLADEHASRIIDELMPKAAKLTVGELIDRIKRMAIALDPDWAERRYRDSVRERRVEVRQNPEGTADLAGRDLPADRAKTGSDRIHQLAQACKTAGDKRRIDTIRADLFLGMLDGQFTGMNDQQIINHVLAHPVADDPTDPDGETDSPGNDADDDHPGDDEGHGSSGGTSDGNPGGPDNPGGHGGPGGPSSGDGSNDGACTGGDTPAGDTAGPVWNVAELRVELSTLLGMDEHPAELPGLGYIPAMVARPLAARMASAEWRFVICTPDGTPICSGITTRRPTGQAGARRDPKRGGILEIQLTSTQLFELATATAGGEHTDWQHVIGDIADRYRRGILDHKTTATDTLVDDAETPPADEDGARRRHARAGLRRWVEVRGRYCLHPACRMPAMQTDLDHRIDYAAGGRTVDDNLDPECRHDHRLQHDGHWRVHRPPGSDPLIGPIIWTSPLGHQYESRPPPVMQPYPEPGSYYPGEDDLPEWFTELVERVRTAQQAARTTAPTSGDSEAADAEPPNEQRQRRTMSYEGEPPF